LLAIDKFELRKSAEQRSQKCIIFLSSSGFQIHLLDLARFLKNKLNIKIESFFEKYYFGILLKNFVQPFLPFKTIQKIFHSAWFNLFELLNFQKETLRFFLTFFRKDFSEEFFSKNFFNIFSRKKKISNLKESSILHFATLQKDCQHNF